MQKATGWPSAPEKRSTVISRFAAWLPPRPIHQPEGVSSSRLQLTAHWPEAQPTVTGWREAAACSAAWRTAASTASRCSSPIRSAPSGRAKGGIIMGL